MSEQPGSIGEEAAKLFEAVQAWLADVPAGNGSPDCELCPLCHLIAMMRGVRPETVEHLVGVATSLLVGLRTVLERQDRAWTARRPAGVQHIHVG